MSKKTTDHQDSVKEESAKEELAQDTSTPEEGQSEEGQGEDSEEGDLTEGSEADGTSTADSSEDEEGATDHLPPLPAEVQKSLEAQYPVLQEHGTHGAAMKGLQTDASGSYDRSKL